MARLLMACGLALASFGAATQPSSTPILFRTIAQGSTSGIDTHRELVVRTVGLWDFVWHKHGDTAPRPEVDFRKEMVLGVFSGRLPAMRSVEIVRVGLEDGSVVVRYRQRIAREPQPAGAVRFSPFQVVAIPIQQSGVRFEVIADSTVSQ